MKIPRNHQLKKIGEINKKIKRTRPKATTALKFVIILFLNPKSFGAYYPKFSKTYTLLIIQQLSKGPFLAEVIHILVILWGQPIELIQVLSTLEFHEYWWKNIVYTFLSPSLCAGPQKPWTLTASKIKYQNFWQKI